MSPHERRRLLGAALAAYETALDHAAQLGGAGRVHGIPANRLERFAGIGIASRRCWRR